MEMREIQWDGDMYLYMVDIILVTILRQGSSKFLVNVTDKPTYRVESNVDVIRYLVADRIQCY